MVWYHSWSDTTEYVMPCYDTCHATPSHTILLPIMPAIFYIIVVYFLGLLLQKNLDIFHVKISVQKDSPFLHTVILSRWSDRAVSVSDVLFRDISICDTLSSLAVSVSVIIDSYRFSASPTELFTYPLVFLYRSYILTEGRSAIVRFDIRLKNIPNIIQ